MPVGAMNLQEGGKSFSKRSGHGLFPSWHISWNWALWKSSKGCSGVKGGNLMHLHILGWCFSTLHKILQNAADWNHLRSFRKHCCIHRSHTPEILI